MIQKLYVVSNSLNKDIQRQIRSNENNKFGSSRGNKCEEEKASKGQEGRKINKKQSEQQRQNKEWRIWAETTTGDINTSTTIACVIASISENRNKTTRKWEGAKYCAKRKKARTDEPEILKEMAEEAFALPYHKTYSSKLIT